MAASVQHSLFDESQMIRTGDRVHATSRRTDPETSHLAAANHESSGRATSHRNILANYVREHPGTTNGEAAKALPEIGYQEITRRMGEIAKLGLIRRGEARLCAEHGTMQTTWFPT